MGGPEPSGGVQTSSYQRRWLGLTCPHMPTPHSTQQRPTFCPPQAHLARQAVSAGLRCAVCEQWEEVAKKGQQQGGLVGIKLLGEDCTRQGQKGRWAGVGVGELGCVNLWACTGRRGAVEGMRRSLHSSTLCCLPGSLPGSNAAAGAGPAAQLPPRAVHGQVAQKWQQRRRTLQAHQRRAQQARLREGAPGLLAAVQKVSLRWLVHLKDAYDSQRAQALQKSGQTWFKRGAGRLGKRVA